MKKLEPRKVKEIYQKAHNGEWGIQRELAENYGISEQTVSDIKHERDRYGQYIED